VFNFNLLKENDFDFQSFLLHPREHCVTNYGYEFKEAVDEFSDEMKAAIFQSSR
jgi:hypothetical protein